MKLTTPSINIDNFIGSLKTIIAITTLSCLSTMSFAISNSERVYQIELFIFANTDPNSAGDEVWPEDLGLAYPEGLITLQDKNNPDVNIDQLAGGSGLRNNTPQDPNEEPMFVLLDPSQRILTNAVNRILARPNFKKLYHEAWLQKVGKRNAPNHILIRGGKQFDKHFELEGSISLSVARYLHINTDLWLSSFVTNRDDSQQLWPVLPRVPNANDVEQNTLFNNNSQSQPMNFSNTNSTLENSLTDNLFDNPFQEMETSQYAVEQTIVMRQHSRMRSKELHYIDHPKMGLLIKIIRYKRPKP